MGIDWEDMYEYEDYDPCDYDDAYEDDIDDWNYALNGAYRKNRRDTTRCYIRCPYSEKESAKRRGARWDPVRKLWYYEAWMDPRPFAKWKAVN